MSLVDVSCLRLISVTVPAFSLATREMKGLRRFDDGSDATAAVLRLCFLLLPLCCYVADAARAAAVTIVLL